MARISGVPKEKGGLLLRLARGHSRRKLGVVPEPVEIAGHHGGILQAMGAYEFFLERAKRVDSRLKTLASIKAATLIGCPF